MSCRSTILALGMAALLPLSAGASGVSEEAGLQVVETFEQGKPYSAGPVRVVRLEGGDRQMGRHSGRVLRNEMAETSGLGLEKHVLLNAVEWLNWLVRPGGHCSGLAVWGKCTGSAPLLFGRNNDDAAFVKLFAPHLVVVLDPLDGSIPVAIVNCAGLVSAPNGLNAKGVFLELDSGSSMGCFPDRVSLCATLFSFLPDYSTVVELEPAFKAIRADLSSILAAADLAGAASFECSPVEARRCTPEKPGVLAATAR